jgi:polysaccharide export outer membrane protein
MAAPSVLVLLAGCASLSPASAPVPGAPETLVPAGSLPVRLAPVAAPAPPSTEVAEYRLSAGDVIEVSIFRSNVQESDDLRRQMMVRPDGKISYFFVGDVQAAGFTTEQVRQEMVKRLSMYVRSPEGLAVILVDTAKKRVYVTGEVVEQGVRELKAAQGDSILDAIFASKGLTKKANADRAYVIRRNEVIDVPLGDLLLRGDRSKNVTLQSEDVVYVPEVVEQRVFVVGRVRRPGAFEISRPIRLMEALALAEDFSLGAKNDDVKIIRGGFPIGPEPQQVTSVDVEKIREGATPDVYVQRGDIVLVPSTALGKWNDILNQLLPSLQTLLLGTLMGTNVK